MNHRTTGSESLSGSGSSTTGGGGASSGTSTSSGAVAGAGTSTNGGTSGDPLDAARDGGGCATVFDLEEILAKPVNDCPRGEAMVLGRLVDPCMQDMQVDSSQVSVSDLYSAAIPVRDLDCGDFYFCVADGGAVTPLIQASGRLPILLPTFDPYARHDPLYGQPSLVIPADPGINLVCADFANQLSASLIAPAYDPTAATLVITLEDNTSGKLPCSDVSGWTFALHDAQGNALDVPVAYVSGGQGFDPLASATDGSGTAVFYNFPNGVSSVTLGAQHVSLTPDGGDPKVLPDGGDACPSVLMWYGESPTVAVAAGSVTFFPYVVF